MRRSREVLLIVSSHIRRAIHLVGISNEALRQHQRSCRRRRMPVRATGRFPRWFRYLRRR